MKESSLLGTYRSLARILDRVFGEVEGYLRPGVTTAELDEMAEIQILHARVQSSFKGHRGYPAFITASVNEETMNGLPGPRELKSGD